MPSGRDHEYAQVMANYVALVDHFNNLVAGACFEGKGSQTLYEAILKADEAIVRASVAIDRACATDPEFAAYLETWARMAAVNIDPFDRHTH